MIKLSQKDAMKLLNASTKIRNDVSMVVVTLSPTEIVPFLKKLEKEVSIGRVLQIAQVGNRISLICDDPLALRLSKEYKKFVDYYKKDLAAVTMMSPKKAMDTPGLLAHILTKFASKKINVIEIVSCHSDVSFIIKRDNAIRARELLGKFI